MMREGRGRRRRQEARSWMMMPYKRTKSTRTPRIFDCGLWRAWCRDVLCLSACGMCLDGREYVSKRNQLINS
jgi:hypothetical protein